MTARIKITFERWKPVDLELGEPSQRGWIDSEGVRMDPEDPEDRAAVEAAVEFLNRKGAVHPSSDPPTGIDLWFSTEPEIDFETGDQEIRSYHLKGFSVEEELQVFHRIRYG